MTQARTQDHLVTLDVDDTLWSRFFMVAPLVIVGTREGNGFDLAPKHMAGPVSWAPYFGFACAPRHATYRNARKSGFFTVTFPKPSQVPAVRAAAAPREGDRRTKPSLEGLATFAANDVDGVFLEDGYLFLECKVDRVVDGLGKNSLVIGYVQAAHVDEAYLRREGRDDGELIRNASILAYVGPGRYAEITETEAFPFPAGFER